MAEAPVYGRIALASAAAFFLTLFVLLALPAHIHMTLREEAAREAARL